MSVVRSTLDSSKALVLSGFGIQEGRVLVEDARFKIIQRQRGEKKGGGLVTPMLVLQFDCKRVNENNVAESDAVETTELLVAWGTKEAAPEGAGDIAGLHAFALWPATLTGDPADPSAAIEDPSVGRTDDGKRAYVRIDTEGNTFVSAEGAVPFADAEAMIFMKTLEAKGWKPEINNQSFSGNYKGAVFEVVSVLKKALCEQLGIKYDASREDPARPSTLWKVTNILVRPYETKSKGGKAGAGKAGAAVPGKPGPAAATGGSAGSGSSGANGATAIDDKIKVVLTDYVASLKGKTITQSDFQKAIGPKLLAKVGLGPAQEWVNSNVKPIAALGALGFEYGFEVDEEAKTVKVAEG